MQYKSETISQPHPPPLPVQLRSLGKLVESVQKEMGLTGKTTLASVSEASTPLPLPQTKRPAVRSITVEEINQYWRMKRMIQEDHLLAAEKAVAKIRAKSLKASSPLLTFSHHMMKINKEEDYRKFEESLEETLDEAKGEGKTQANHNGEMETWIRFRDWWTKSKYSYLNQPATESMGQNATTKHPTSTYIPQYTCFANYSSPAQLYFTSCRVLGQK
ncbi:hypothetical protein ZIOFF_045775 [Zingiber officinale]|uniref:Uncharacterized protein n=1 Tax=Zingiber officinale TaxID=94328 RepID=A0A8J5G885_ZINOF|nr:hypothetical protein ZIOFF_045775 [Zingiber officinale]